MSLGSRSRGTCLLRLRQPLGSWLPTAQTTWQTQYHPGSECLFTTKPDGSILQHKITGRSRRHILCDSVGTDYPHAIPTDAVPASTERCRLRERIPGLPVWIHSTRPMTGSLSSSVSPYYHSLRSSATARDNHRWCINDWC